MPSQVVLSAGEFDALEGHLFRNHREQAAFLYADTKDLGNGTEFWCSELDLIATKEVEYHSAAFLSLTDRCLGRVIKRAWDSGTSLIEIHSHTDTSYAAAFSASDIRGLAEVVPHVWWRLQGRPYVAMVISPRGFDAVVWRLDPQHPESLTKLIVGDQVRYPTGLSLARFKLYDRLEQV
jgi:hypothetical protein